ncbi:MAG: glycosyltransferase [Planctomycetes bacterium]|nr:glycosyltransferase [Planctomycetota bacterium]
MRSSGPHPARPIELTYLITDLKVGGVPLHLYRLATSLPPERFRVRVISLADEGPVGGRLRKAGIPVLACGARSVVDVRALARLWRFLIADPPDVLHSLLFHANVAARLVGPLASVAVRRIICEIQTVEVERRWHLPVDGLTCRLCRVEVGNSPSVVSHLHRGAHIPMSRLCCQWGAVDAATIASATAVDRGTLGVAPDERLLLWTGRLDPVKGFEEMLAACAQLKGRHHFKLIMVGDGPYRATVERLAAEHGLGAHVRLVGQRQDVPGLLKAADLFLFCSRTEGLPNSLLEAMAAGLPVVATKVPGCRDVVRHLETGLLVEPGSVDQIARGIGMLLCNQSLAHDLGRRAAISIRQRFDMGVWRQRWIELYRDLARSL